MFNFDISLLAFILGVIATILNIQKSPSSYFIWTFCNIYWLIVDLLSHSYYRSGLDVIYLISSIWGAVLWSKTTNIQQK